MSLAPLAHDIIFICGGESRFMIYCVKTRFPSAKGAKCGWPLHNHKRFRTTRVYFAPSALPRIREPLPGALPQAVTSRAFGAGKQSFHTVNHESSFTTAVENRTTASQFYFHKRLYREVVLTSLPSNCSFSATHSWSDTQSRSSLKRIFPVYYRSPLAIVY